MNFIGSGKRLSDLDLPRIGHEIGVGEDEIHAILDVEASGGGFDAKGRLKALYEPHKAYEYSAGEVRQRLFKAGLAYPKWGEKPYPADSYPRITAAVAIDEAVALKATSWGLPQILGSNFLAAGYVSPRAMVDAFRDGGEPEQLEAMIRFIKHEHLDDELRAHNWAALARGYNGPKYATHGYHLKLASRYSHWALIKDTPWAPGTTQVAQNVPLAPVTVRPPAPAPKALPAAPAAPKPIPAPASAPNVWQRMAERLRTQFPKG